MRFAAACALSLWACSAQQSQPASSHGVPTPLSTDVAARAPALATQGTTAGPLRLDEFTPLLAQPVLQRAALALEAGDAARAAREVEQVMTKTPPAAVDVPRWQLLLARLREQAGDLRGAGASYDLAAAASWPLTGYALLGAGRVLVRQGRAADALERLKRTPHDQPLRSEVRLLKAEAAYNTGDRDLAITAWREHLAGGAEALDRAGVALRLSAALLERVTNAAGTGTASGDQAKAAPAPASDAATLPELIEALRLARRVVLESTDDKLPPERAVELERRALSALPAAERSRLQRPSPEEDLVRLGALVQARRHADAQTLAETLLAQIPKPVRWSAVGCEAGVLRAKASAGLKEWGRAADSLDDVIRSCTTDKELWARAVYLAGTYAASDGRHAQAIQRFEQLEKDLPRHTLADDARLKAAISHYEMGSEARFTELLSTMQDDFPEGDMVLDGVFRLAVRRVEKGDWSGAAAVLDRAAALASSRDGIRGQEFSGRERYFRARAWMQTGERDRGIAELETIVRELPLSYYMLHAYSRLIEIDPFRARRARDEAMKRATEQPFTFEHRPEFDTPGFLRSIELLRVGDLEAGKREIAELGLARQGTTPAVLWGIALLYARAGSAKLSHAVARGLLTDWLSRWPAGDWSKAWEIAFPRPYRAVVEREAKRNKVPVSLVYAVMREESAFDSEAVSPADAHGLMQLIVPTARSMAKPVGLPSDARSLKVPAINIALGCRMLSMLGRSFDDNPLLMLPGYNAGPGRPRRWLADRPNLDVDVWVELIPFNETRRYTKRVLASRAAYAFLYEPQTADEAMALPIKIGG
jgi:soluble lytic murein transglycosylase